MGRFVGSLPSDVHVYAHEALVLGDSVFEVASGTSKERHTILKTEEIKLFNEVSKGVIVATLQKGSFHDQEELFNWWKQFLVDNRNAKTFEVRNLKKRLIGFAAYKDPSLEELTRIQGFPKQSRLRGLVSQFSHLGDSASKDEFQFENFLVSPRSQSWGKLSINTGVTGKPITIGSERYSVGLGTHADSEILLRFTDSPSILKGSCGYDYDPLEVRGDLSCRVEHDDQVLFETGLLFPGDPPQPFEISVSGLTEVLLVVDSGSGGINGDHAAWIQLETLP